MIVIAFWRLKSESFRFQPLFAFFILVIGCISYFGPSASAHAEPGCMSVVEHVMAEPPPPHEGLITARTCDRELGGKAWLDPIIQTISQECVGSVVEKVQNQGQAIKELFQEVTSGITDPAKWVELNEQVVPTIVATKTAKMLRAHCEKA